jgi:molybdopterin molybdotransferase
MISVEEAQSRIRDAMAPLGAECVSLSEAHGRVLAEPLRARVSLPPFDVSAMDGYAVRAADAARIPARLRLIGESAAGGRFDGMVGPGEAVRIFTGAPMPVGADAVVLQEDTEREAAHVVIGEAPHPGRHVRPAGLDFTTGDPVLAAGTLLSARHIGLVAAMNHPWVMVHRRPRVAILSTGDELAQPGDPVGPNQIVNSNFAAIGAMVATAGGEAIQLGVAPDDPAALTRLAGRAKGADVFVTIGGASVGDYDLVQEALGAAGLVVDFWKIAMRPGKPMLFGRLGDAAFLGLPGNPVSAVICSLLFLLPALERLQGLPGDGPRVEPSRLGADLPANDQRQSYLRARLTRDETGKIIATAAAEQDSSMISVLAAAEALIVRPPFGPALAAGGVVPIIRLGGGVLPV